MTYVCIDTTTAPCIEDCITCKNMILESGTYPCNDCHLMNKTKTNIHYEPS